MNERMTKCRIGDVSKVVLYDLLKYLYDVLQVNFVTGEAL